MINDPCKDCGSTHNRAHTDCVIPDAPFYVVSDDPFMSDWFGVNTGLKNCPVVPCDTYDEARRVFDYVTSRRDQKRIRLVVHKPRHRTGRVLTIVSGWKRPAKTDERTDD